MPSWRFRLVARTHASHAWNTGSIPVGATKKQVRKKVSVEATKVISVFIKRRFRLVARTHASHAWNTGSIPVGATSVRTFKVLIFFVPMWNSPTVKNSSVTSCHLLFKKRRSRSTALAGREL